MGGKQGVGLGAVVQLGGNAGGQRQAVKGGGAAPDLVHQHQRLRRGAVQNLRGLQHLQHEGGLRVGQVVGRADAGVDGVNRPQPAGAGRHMAADAGQQHDHRHLAHVGGFTAHIGAGDDLHALLGAQVRVIGNEAAPAGLGQPRLHHRVAPGGDVQAGLAHKLRCAPVQRQRAFGQGAQRVQRGQRAGQPGQRRHRRLQLV